MQLTLAGVIDPPDIIGQQLGCSVASKSSLN